MPAPFTAVTTAPTAAVAPTKPAGSDWSVPAEYRGKTISRRVRYFPQKLLALTFDDGPSRDITPQILRILAAHHAHATFFVIGLHARQHPDLLRQALAGGNAVGNHSYSHQASYSPAKAVQELEQTAQTIFGATGKRPTIFRPPYGLTRGTLAQTARKQGYACVTWTISTADTRPISSDAIARNVIHTPNPGDIVLMHDYAGHIADPPALDRILTELGAQGYRFVTVPELLRAWDTGKPKRAQAATSALKPGRAAGTQAH